MSEYRIELQWNRNSPDFEYTSYTRDHTITFGGGNSLCASAAPEYQGNAECLNPEQAFVASMVSCHMLTFIALASKKRYIVDSYRDNPAGILGRNEHRKPAIVKIAMAPHVVFSGEKYPTDEEYAQLHEKAHDNCFIANSVAQCVKLDINPTREHR